MILKKDGFRFEIPEGQLYSMREFLKKKVREIPHKLSSLTIAEHAQRKRIMPAGTPRPGPWDNDYTPYLKEIMDEMSPFSSTQRVALLKSAQVGATAMMENVICYYMDEYPADILFISGTKHMLERWAARRLEPAINSYGLREKIYAQSQGKTNKRTGDKMYSKEYHGCRLDMASAQSPSELRATDKRILLRDEIDGAPVMLRTGEGNWLDVSYARTNAWGVRRKVFDGSTPTTYETSQIWLAYQQGDQRKFLVACPFCGKYQELEFGSESTKHGLKAEMEAGKLIDVYYVCAHCGEGLQDHHKAVLLHSGYWEPTAKPMTKFFKSYYINSLYSPPNMLSWVEIYQHYLKAQETPDGMRSFTNLYLGLPYRETGERPKLEKVISQKGHYSKGEIPEGVLFLTAGIDVQQGWKHDTRRPARLEMEICGFGRGFRTWSIDYKIFVGAIDDPFSGAWEKLYDWGLETGLTYYRKDGTPFPIVLVLIDSGDGPMTNTVYTFCEGWGNTFPVKGFQALTKKKLENPDEDPTTPHDFKRYRPTKINDKLWLYSISSNYYRNRLYNSLKIPRIEGPEQRKGFCDFPQEYDEKYFKQLTAAEKRTDGTYYKPTHRAAEALDCRVFNLCAHDIFFDREVEYYRDVARKKGASTEYVMTVDKRIVLDVLEKRISKR